MREKVRCDIPRFGMTVVERNTGLEKVDPAGSAKGSGCRRHTRTR